MFFVFNVNGKLHISIYKHGFRDTPATQVGRVNGQLFHIFQISSMISSLQSMSYLELHFLNFGDWSPASLQAAENIPWMSGRVYFMKTRICSIFGKCSMCA